MTGDEDEAKVRIFLNTNANMSRGKAAAQAVHAALMAAGVHPGIPVVVLGGKSQDIENMRTVVRDAGRTELEPGTLTAGTDWAPDRTLVMPSGIVSNNVDTADLPLPALIAMADFVAEHPTMMAPDVISKTIRDLIARLAG